MSALLPPRSPRDHHPGAKPGTYDLTPGWLMALRTKLRRLQHRRSAKMPDYETRTINGQAVRHVVSLGTHCMASLILRNAGLKRYSLPFDWIHATPGMVRHVLETDFSDFLPPEGQERHATFHDRFGLRHIFVHRDIASAQGRAYYGRCITRFRKLMSARDGKLFVMISRPANPIAWHFPDLVDLLGRLTPNAELLAIQLQPPRDGHSMSIELANERRGSRLYDFRPASDESALGYFPDVVDELMILRLIYQYHLDLAETP